MKTIKFFDYFLLKESAVPVQIFHLTDLDEQAKRRLFQVFEESYKKTTGQAWPDYAFFSRAKKWVFYGIPPVADDASVGFVAVRPQQGGLFKLVGAAGSPLAVARGLKLLLSENKPVWAAVDDYLANHLLKLGFIEPPMKLLQRAAQEIPALAKMIGDDNLQVRIGGGIGIKKKRLLGNRQYFEFLFNLPTIPDDIKQEISLLLGGNYS